MSCAGFGAFAMCPKRQHVVALATLLTLALTLVAPLVAGAASEPPKVASGQATVNKSCGVLDDSDPVGAISSACDHIAGALPDVPSPKDIAELPQKVAGDVLNGIKDDVVSTMAAGVAQAASWLLGKTLDAITGSTTPDVTSRWFVGQYAQMAGLAALFAIPFLVLAAIQSVAATDWGILGRAAFVEAPLAFLFTAMAVGVTALLLSITDGMTDWVTHSSQADTESFVKSLVKLYVNTGTLAVPPFLELIAAITAVAGAFLVWLELIVREAAIYICLAFVPFVMAARIWPRIAHWCRRLVEIGVVIIFSKFAIAAIFALAAGALGQVGQPKDLRAVFAGTALVLLAAFAPYALLKLIPMAEGAVAAVGGHRQHLQGAVSTGPVPSPAALMQDQLRNRFLGSGGGGGAATGSEAAGEAETTAGGTAEAGGAAGAGSAGLAVLGADATKEAATAGPKAGAALGAHTDQLAGSSGTGAERQLSSYDGQSAAAGRSAAAPERPVPPAAGGESAGGASDASTASAESVAEAPTNAAPPVSWSPGSSGRATSAPGQPTAVDGGPGPSPDVGDPAPNEGPPTPPPPNRMEE